MKNKKFKYGLNSTILLIGVLAIIVILNVFVTALVERYPIKVDLTSTQRYEISDKTYQFLKGYEKPTTIYVLSTEAEEDLIIKNILEKYSTTNKNIEVKNINTAENPTFGKKYIKDGESLISNSVIIDAGDRFKIYSPYDLYNFQTDNSSGRQYATSIKAEQKITAGLKYVSSDEDFRVGFIKGHNEIELDGARQSLENNNYVINDINLATDDIPSNIKMLVIASPTVDYTMAEIAKLDSFFSNSGKAQFIFDNSSTGLTNLYSYIKEWGIQVNDDVAVETDNSSKMILSSSNMFLVKPELEKTDITAPIAEAQRIMAYYPYSKSLTTLFESNSGVEVIKLLSTTDAAYTTTDFENLSKADDAKTGEFTIAAVSTKQGSSPEKDSIIFVSGSPLLLDIDIAAVSDIYGFANDSFYENVTNFVQGEKDDYSIAAKSLSSDKLTISEFDGLVIFIIFIIIIPVAILIYGIVVWFKRRHL